MAEYDLKKSIPRENFNIQENIFNRPSLTNPKMIVVGDPYIDFTKNEKTYKTRHFNHSELVGNKIKYQHIGGFQPSSGKIFTIPLMEMFQSNKITGKKDGKLIGHINGYIDTNMKNGNNVLNITTMQIFHGDYGTTFAKDKKDVGLKVNIGRNILSQVIQKLPFIDEIQGYRISGARRVADDTREQSRTWIDKILRKKATASNKWTSIKPEMISKIKNNLANKGLIDSFFTQAKLSTDNIKEWLTKNNRAVAGVAMSGNDPMQSLGVKGMGSPIDNAANYYLAMAEGGFIEGDEFGDMIEFMPSMMMRDGGIVGVNYLTRSL
jgi:hypothetical protein